ncbi:MAG: SseB family protein [Lachnospiraceae bacterium]|nr:SseB family protein [Lachnospiraceae bacterium]
MKNKDIQNKEIKNDELKDEGLKGNEKIENAIASLQADASEERLAHTLTVIRRRMRENGQFIVAVEPPSGEEQIKVQDVKTPDGKNWWMAFTSFEEELKGSNSVMSTFLTDINKMFTSALEVDEIDGIIINPWNRTIMLDKNLISIILGNY